MQGAGNELERQVKELNTKLSATTATLARTKLQVDTMQTQQAQKFIDIEQKLDAQRSYLTDLAYSNEVNESKTQPALLHVQKVQEDLVGKVAKLVD